MPASRSRPSSARRRTPRPFDALPYAADLVELDVGGLESDGDYELVSVPRVTLDGVEASGARFTESTFSGTRIVGGAFDHARFHDVWMHGVQFAGTDLTRTTWIDAELVNVSLAGIELYDGGLTRVAFFGCRFDSVNLRGTTLRDVLFEDCVVSGLDIGGATLADVTFPGCTVTDLRATGARLRDVDFRGAERLRVADGHDALRGGTIGYAQAVDLAPELAAALGITVRD